MRVGSRARTCEFFPPKTLRRAYGNESKATSQVAFCEH